MEQQNKLSRINSFQVVGTLVSAEVTNGTRKDNGQDFVSVDVTVENNLGGKTNKFDINLFASRYTKENKESQLYANYVKLPEMIGKKIQIDGDIRENRYWSKNQNQVVSAQQLSGRFVRAVTANTEDVAKFDISGFIVQTLVERTNKDGEVYRYDIALGQSNFKGDNMSKFTLHVDPSARDIVAGVENYEVGMTVRLNGILGFYEEKVVVQDNNNAFGAAVSRTYTNRQHNFYITGGSNPIEDETAYSRTDIDTLINAYKANDVVIQGNASANATSAPTTSATPVSKRQASLI